MKRSAPQPKNALLQQMIRPFFLFCTSAFLALAHPVQAAGTSYVAVIDAGSSGTRLFYYKVMPATGKIEMLTSKYERTNEEDGIDNHLCDGPREAVNTQIISPLLEYLKQNSGGVKPERIRVNLYATAGMRSRAENCYPNAATRTQQVRAYYDLIKQGIKSQHFRVGEARTIDGDKEEGIWTWLNLNYVLNSFQPTPYADLEVGGSSTQIVYPTHAPVDPSQNIFKVKYRGQKYNVFSKSYLGLGQDDARKWLRTTANPQVCWPTGFDPSKDTSDTRDKLNPIPAPGVFDFQSCQAAFQGYIASKMAGLPPQTERSLSEFVGLDGVWYAYKDFLKPTSDNPSLQGPQIPLVSQLPTQVSSTCTQPSTSLLQGFYSSSNAQKQCVSGTYLSTLMFDNGPGKFFTGPSRLVTRTRPNEAVLNGIAQSELSWTRGFLLQKYFANK